MFRRRNRISERCVHHHDSGRGRRRHVNRIDTDTGPTDNLDRRGRLHNIGGNFAEERHAIPSYAPTSGISSSGLSPVRISKSIPLRRKNLLRLFIHFIGNQNFRHGTLLLDGFSAAKVMKDRDSLEYLCALQQDLLKPLLRAFPRCDMPRYDYSHDHTPQRLVL